MTLTSCEETEPIVDDTQTEQEGNEDTGNEGEDVPEEGEGQETPEPEDPATLALDKVTATTAVFKGHLNVPSEKVSSSKVTLCYSDAETFNVKTAKKAYVTRFDEEQNFTINLTDLKHSANYNYCVIVDVKDEKTEGEVLSFSTSTVAFDDVEVDAQLSEAEIACVVTGVSVEDEGCIKAGLYYSSEAGKVEAGEGIKLNAVVNVPSEGTLSFSLMKLNSGTKYYYCFYFLQGDHYSYSEVYEFRTASHPYDSQNDMDLASATDLSASATANSYVVSEAGLYKFRAVKGNSTESVNASSASILWETFGTSEVPELFDLIKSFGYKDGYIAFQTADTFKEGNAVVAAKDEAGNILWSWHIWMTDQPEGQEYFNNAGIMMDRNLGATSATPGDVGALGLHYQWGRKDPFMGSSSISSSEIAKSTITWPTPAQSNSSRGTIDFAIANPTVFISGNGINYDWYYSGNHMTENSRWSASSKTIYDPCPAGWRVPEGGESGIWAKALGSDSYSLSCPFDETNKGVDFSGRFGSAETIWYPAAGYRTAGEGSFIQVGVRGYYWSASPWPYYEDYAGAQMLSLLSSGSVTPSDGEDRALGQAIRCVKE